MSYFVTYYFIDRQCSGKNKSLILSLIILQIANALARRCKAEITQEELVNEVYFIARHGNHKYTNHKYVCFEFD